VAQRREVAPHPATVAQRREVAPHPATVAQPFTPSVSFTRAPALLGVPRPPHPATVTPPRPPHPALVSQRRTGPPEVRHVQRMGAPVLTCTSRGATKQNLGQFQFEVRFGGLASTEGGWIVQQVDRAATVTGVYGTRPPYTLSAAEIDSLSSVSPNYSSWTRYWEAFQVAAGTSIDDHFSFSQMDLQGTNALPGGMNANWTTRGRFTIGGAATFFRTTQPATSIGFAAGSTNNPANTLPWATNDPATHLTAFTSSNAVAHAADVTWNKSATKSLTYSVGTRATTI
jgi:hypothetical protein